MQKNRPQIFMHSSWAPSELEALSGLTPVAVRDLRRRGLAPASEGRTLKLTIVAQLFLLSELTAHGFGPKRVKETSEEFAEPLTEQALSHGEAWADDKAHAAWLASKGSKKQAANLILFEGPEKKARGLSDLAELHQLRWSTVSVVDLKSLGSKLAKHLAERPSWLFDREGANQS